MKTQNLPVATKRKIQAQNQMMKVNCTFASLDGIVPYDFDSLPAEKCEYCGIHDPNYIVKCDAKGCNKWFCNQFQKSMGSHIVVHLVKAKHNQISLHPSSEMSELKIECFYCKNKEQASIGLLCAIEARIYSDLASSRVKTASSLYFYAASLAFTLSKKTAICLTRKDWTLIR